MAVLYIYNVLFVYTVRIHFYVIHRDSNKIETFYNKPLIVCIVVLYIDCVLRVSGVRAQ